MVQKINVSFTYITNHADYQRFILSIKGIELKQSINQSAKKIVLYENYSPPPLS